MMVGLANDGCGQILSSTTPRYPMGKPQPKLPPNQVTPDILTCTIGDDDGDDDKDPGIGNTDDGKRRVNGQAWG